MKHLRRRAAALSAFLVAACVLAAPGAAQSPADTGRWAIDFSAFDEFWRVADALSRDVEPSDSQWQALLSSPAYRLVQTNLGPVMRQAIEVAFRPSRRADRERLNSGMSNAAMVATHLLRAAAQRSDLVAFRDSLARSNVIADAVAVAARYLPPGATLTGRPPPVSAALFLDDGYALPDGIVIDLLNARRVALTRNLGHEFHHSYVNRLARPLPPDAATAADAGLRQALYDLRNEGIADQIDKPWPFSSPNPGLADYVAGYRDEYPRTPARLVELDSLLQVVYRDSTQLSRVSDRARSLFRANGHPNGAYIAREISAVFGVDSLRAAALDPAAFLRMYAEAERQRGRPAPFSPEAWSVVERLDAKYWRSR